MGRYLGQTYCVAGKGILIHRHCLGKMGKATSHTAARHIKIDSVDKFYK